MKPPGLLWGAVAEWLARRACNQEVMSSTLVDHESRHVTVLGQNCSHHPTP
jgi:hypothetical protein